VAAAPGSDGSGPALRSDSLEAAERLLRDGRAEEAASAFSRLVDAQPGDGRAIEGRVRALLVLDRWREALGEAREHHARHPDRPRVVSALGQALFRAGRLEEAQQRLEPLATRHDVPARALLTLSRLRSAAGRVEEAQRLVGRALESAEQDRDLHFWAAEVAGTREEALGHLRRYLELSAGDDPDRIEAARDTVELYRELGDRVVWEAEQLPPRLELPLRPIWNRQGTRLGFVVEVRLGDKGKPVRLLLDTGSPGLFLVERLARKRGFQPLVESITFGGGGDRRHRSPRGVFSRFRLGELGFREALATTTRTELEPLGRFHGVVGLSIFNGYRVTLDLPGKRLLLEPGREEASGSPYWICSAQMLIRVDAASGASGLFLLDTGASWSIVSMSFVEEAEGARLGSRANVRAFGGDVEGARLVHDLSLEFQGLRTRDELRAVDLSLRSRLTGTEISGYLGLDALDRTTIVIDTVARRVSVSRRDKR
jgi:hypothetical protein